MKIKIVSRSGNELGNVEVADNATVKDLKTQTKQFKKVSLERQYFNIQQADGKKGSGFGTDDSKKLSELGVSNGSTLIFKDLGPQIPWKTVFLVEYFGSLVAFPVIYALRPLLFSNAGDLSQTQWIAFALFFGHFLKRELETLFVHKFSNGFMPIMNIFKNSGYYWAFAFYIAYFTLHPLYTSPSTLQVYIGSAVFVLCELSNLYCHIILSNLRPTGTTQRQIPRGFLFELVSCPNYFFEIMAWFAFSFATSSVPSLLFALVGGAQMWVWAVGKHKRYRKEFPDYPKKRKILIPYLL